MELALPEFFPGDVIGDKWRVMRNLAVFASQKSYLVQNVASKQFATYWIEDDIYETLEKFADAKEATHQIPSQWLQSTPEEFQRILEYLMSTSPEHEPDYDQLAGLLKTALQRALKENGGNATLDWEPGGLYHEELRQIFIDWGMD